MSVVWVPSAGRPFERVVWSQRILGKEPLGYFRATLLFSMLSRTCTVAVNTKDPPTLLYSVHGD